MGQNFNFNPKDYVTVAERIQAFIDKYPDGSLQAEIIRDEVISEEGHRQVIIRACAYRWPDDARPGVGHAHEVWDGNKKNYINEFSIYENGESSAWGRALAALGFEVKRGIASKEEMEGAANRKNPQKVTVEDDRQQKALAVYQRVRELHEKLGVSDSDEAKKELLMQSKVATSFKNIQVDKLEKYADFLETQVSPETAEPVPEATPEPAQD